MKRNRYLCYAILIALPAVFLLFLLAIYSFVLALAAVLGIIIALGVLNQRRPELFSWLRKPSSSLPPIYTPPHDSPIGHDDDRRTYLMLSSTTGYNTDYIAVNRPVFVVGRARDCQHVLNDAKVSSHHLTIEYDFSDKLCYVTDNSTNGTFLNSIRLNRNARCALKQGDILQIAGNAYSVEYVHF